MAPLQRCLFVLLFCGGLATTITAHRVHPHPHPHPHPHVACPLEFVMGTTILFVADPGSFSGTAEDTYYDNNLELKTPIPKGLMACVDGYKGIIMRQNVAVITTGIGPTAAALCVYDVLTQCGGQIKDVFYSGTSGFSAQLGGVINNGACAQANQNTAAFVRIGDVCVSPFSVSWDCRQASWDMTTTGKPNQCTFPEQLYGPANDTLFGQCEFTDVTESDMALTDEVLAVAAANKNNMPVRDNSVQALDADYWGNMSVGTGAMYPTLNQAAPPRIWNYRQCMEVDSQYFWSGAPWDIVARAYVADTLNNAPRVDRQYSQSDVIAVSAMEGIGLAMAMQRYNSLTSTRRRIPFTIVRGTSDWVHPPLINQGAGVWAAGPTIENFAAGFKYAISTTSSVVLSTLQARCNRLHETAAGDDVMKASASYSRRNACSFVIDYHS